MKATIRSDGMLMVAPESDLEAYALSRWSSENLSGNWFDVRRGGFPVIVDLSDFPQSAAVFACGGPA
jgi:hypothetical protein